MQFLILESDGKREPKMPQPRRNVSPERKATYYVGMMVSGIGLLLFLSFFLTVAAGFANPANVAAGAGSAFARAVFGFVMIAAGQFIARIGSRGIFGSGMLLDPEKEREDLEPWNRMAGGMADDTLSELGVVKAVEKALTRGDDEPEQREVIKIRCRSCQALNDEDAKFCDQCGAAV